MKDFLLLIIGGAILVAVFADGGLELSPTISPAFDAQLNLQYAPDRSVTTIEQQTNIDTNIERQQTTIIYQDAPVGAGGVSLVQSGPGRCAAQPGDVVESEQGNGACYVWSGNRKYFINPNGNRWEVDTAGQLPPAASPPAASTTIVTTTVLLAPDVPRTLLEFQAAFLRNGGEVPFLWNLRGDDFKVKWLSQQAATWQ